ncbi:YidH family protein [Rhodococcus sp. NBC_00294]|uniref:YidH family protein n=1 Tax=Rhodococcus sp. NBC_00294 TaxID=2976004 RepID=UPI002E2CF266|nr:DUF202 domain-containing protein [Rhodococcus sp. NBC_00294]
MPQEKAHDRRRPRRVYSVGAEPDARFSLANERTYLAWIRTSLAFMAAGVALDVFDVGGDTTPARIASVLLIGCSVVLPLHAWWAWGAVESSLRRSRPLPSPRVGAPLAVLLAVAAALVVWSVFS